MTDGQRTVAADEDMWASSILETIKDCLRGGGDTQKMCETFPSTRLFLQPGQFTSAVTETETEVVGLGFFCYHRNIQWKKADVIKNYRMRHDFLLKIAKLEF